MAKKSKKIDKDTRKLIESISSLVKKKGDRYKFKSKKKKLVKKVKQTCCHWTIRKGKELPTVIRDPEKAGYCKCAICGASFPLKPQILDDGTSMYKETVTKAMELVNQIQFLSVKLGGDAEDTKMFLKLKENLPRFAKVSQQIIKRINKREEFDKRAENGNSMARFDSYSGFGYKI